MVRAWDELLTAFGVTQLTVDQIRAEADYAATKHGRHRTPASPDMSDYTRLAILVEEVGEVARAMTYDNADRKQLESELVQVAAVAAMWVDGLEAERYSDVRSDQ